MYVYGIALALQGDGRHCRECDFYRALLGVAAVYRLRIFAVKRDFYFSIFCAQVECDDDIATLIG